MATTTRKAPPTMQLALAWGFVGIPLTLGVSANAGQRDEAFQ